MESENMSVDHSDESRIGLGLRKYVCELTLDPKTPHTVLSLSDGNRRVTFEGERQYRPGGPGKFTAWPQVLCSQGLSGQCYWEVEWTGNRAEIGVAYKKIGRNDDTAVCRLGANDKSWILCCTNNSSSAYHNKQESVIASPPSSRVGVYLDWVAGTLSFYSISCGKMTLLHTFHSHFTQPLHPAFGLYTLGCSVHICQLK
ncbi:stonustoxin subunit beta-like [Paramormyrops kingsleyae]|uniref:stonustoxin subunit beta-like n=1 Tax=Paramormyrops kingsleyae TaxID=1676925 RepID=UPI000CD640FD|nr:stonustoxin subunit beta-like [Paramormyrops kingsleyae]XP_023687157.1 stonustoxin subunit beta-like [Paramormyrops kingsleyae]XP_023687158.1 stonustoxin subunit beta-like [Paramormyrops kingsleyae]